MVKKLLELNPQIFYARPNINKIKQWNNRDQMEGVIDNTDKLLKKYDKVSKKLKKHGFRVTKYDYTKDHQNVIVKPE